LVLYDGDKNSPFRWLQNVDDGELAFAVVNPFMVVKDYDFEYPMRLLKVLVSKVFWM